MQQDISKICADSLRTFSSEKYNFKLKASHAHELVAAFFGYSSKNAMVADTRYPITNLGRAEIVVMTSDDFIDKRREKLKGLSSELPDNYTLGEVIYSSLFTDEWWVSQFPPFRNYEKLAYYLLENNPAYQETFKFYRNVPMQQIVVVQDSEHDVLIMVLHSPKTSSGEKIVVGKTNIYLPRIAGRIGYSKPRISVEQWTGQAMRTLDSLGVQL